MSLRSLRPERSVSAISPLRRVPRILHQALTRSPQTERGCGPPSAVIPGKVTALALAVSCVCHKGDVTCTLDCNCQSVLMARAVTAYATWQNFAAFCYKFFELVRIFVVNKIHFVCAESARFAAAGQSILIVTHFCQKPLLFRFVWGFRMGSHRRKRRWHLSLRRL